MIYHFSTEIRFLESANPIRGDTIFLPFYKKNYTAWTKLNRKKIQKRVFTSESSMLLFRDAKQRLEREKQRKKKLIMKL